MKDKALWAMIAFFVVWVALVHIEHYQFLSHNPWHHQVAPWAGHEDTMRNQEQVPAIVRGFVRMNVTNDVSFLEYQTGRYVRKVSHGVLVLLLVVLVFLAVRQNRMRDQIRELKSRLDATEGLSPPSPQAHDATTGAA